MDSSNVKKLKKAVVSLQKLDLPYQRPCQEMSTESCGSEDRSSENTAIDSVESNVGCTDDDDLEKKIQAFSIPVKKGGETPITSERVVLQTIKPKDSTNTSNEKSKCVKAKPTSQVLKASKTKSGHLSCQDKTFTVKEKVSDDKSSLEKVKLLSSKTIVEKEKVPLGKTSSSKGSTEKISKNGMKNTNKKHISNASSDHKQRKRKHSADYKSLEENDSPIILNPIKSQKQDKQTPSTPSSSKANITTPRTKKSNTPHKNSSDRLALDSRGEVRKVKQHSNSERKKSDKEKTSENASTSKEDRKRKLSESESTKGKKIMKHVKLASKVKTSDVDKESNANNSEQLKNIISLKKNNLQGQSSTKKSTKNDEPRQTADTVSKDKVNKKEIDGSNIPKSRDSSVQNREKSKQSGEKVLSCNKKYGENGPIVTRSGVNKSSKENEDNKIFRKAKLGKVHSHRRSIDVKSTHLKEQRSHDLQFDRSHLHRNKSSVNNKDHEKHKSEKRSKKTKGKPSNVIEKQKKVLKKVEDSLAKSNTSSCIFEKSSIKLAHDKHQDSIFKGKFLLVKSVFKTVSKKSDLLPSQNIGTESYKKIWKWSHHIRMPSSMWSLHKHPLGDYVIILHTSEISSFPKITIDKYVQFKENAVPLVKLYDKEVPSLGTANELQTLGEVCSFLKEIDTISVCENFKNPSVEGSTSNCEMFISKVVDLPFTCKNCSSFTSKTT